MHRDLDNILMPTDANAAWSDHHSTLALVWPEADIAGLQHLRQVRGFRGALITQALWQWRLSEDGVELPVTELRRSYGPHLVQERAMAGDLAVTIEYTWLVRDALLIRLNVSHVGTRPRNLTLHSTPAFTTPPNWEGPFPLRDEKWTWYPAHGVTIDEEDYGSWSALHGTEVQGL